MKKAAKDAIRTKLVDDQNEIRSKLRHGAYEMRKLVDKQTQLKRELAAYGELIKLMDGQG